MCDSREPEAGAGSPDAQPLSNGTQMVYRAHLVGDHFATPGVDPECVLCRTAFAFRPLFNPDSLVVSTSMEAEIGRLIRQEAEAAWEARTERANR